MEGYISNDRRQDVVSGKSVAADLQIHRTTRKTDPETMTRASASSYSKGWGMGDSEMKRKKRIARYKAYSVEGRVKASLRRGLCWIKNKCSHIIHGY